MVYNGIKPTEIKPFDLDRRFVLTAIRSRYPNFCTVKSDTHTWIHGEKSYRFAWINKNDTCILYVDKYTTYPDYVIKGIIEYCEVNL